MGKIFGIIALIFSVIGVVVIIIATLTINLLLLLSPFFYPPLPLVIIIDIIPLICIIVAIVCGAIGIKKDDSHGLAIAGLIIGSIGVIPYIIAIVAVIVNLEVPLF